MVTRILPAVSDADAARALSTLAAQLPGSEPLPPATDSTRLLDLLHQVAAGSAADLPEVVLVHELIGHSPALEVIREVALRFPSVGVVLVTQDTTPGLYSAAMDAGARGVVGLPLAYDELAARVEAAAAWARGVRRHLGHGPDPAAGPAAWPGVGGTVVGGTVVAVTGAKGGVGCTLSAVQIALAAGASGRDTVLVDMNLQSGDVASFLDVQFRRSVVDLAAIGDLTPRVLSDAVFTHDTGLALLLAPAEGERGEEVDDRAARQLVAALRSRYEVVVVDCGTQMHAANAAAVELADRALLVTTPDVISVRAAKRMVRLWDRLQIRKAEDTVAVVNRASRHTEIQPSLIARIVGTPVARATVPAGFKELHTALDAGRIQDVDDRSTVKQALWALAAEVGAAAATPHGGGKSGGKVGKAPRPWPRPGHGHGRGHGRGRPAPDLGSQAVAGGPAHAALPPGSPGVHGAGDARPGGPDSAPGAQRGPRFGPDRGAVSLPGWLVTGATVAARWADGPAHAALPPGSPGVHGSRDAPPGAPDSAPGAQRGPRFGPDRGAVSLPGWLVTGATVAARWADGPARGQTVRETPPRGDAAVAMRPAATVVRPTPSGSCEARRRFGGRRSERGALTVEFAGMVPIVLVVLALLWQCVLIGYTFTLAGNAADEGARAATAAAAYGDPAAACAAAAREHLPSAWNAAASVSCSRSGGLWHADVDLATPVLFPGAANLPFTVSGSAGAALEAG